ncbi:MAG: hypothetical protein Q8O30_07490 [Candidatus Omnitrophota bacterium]|nr:hypothetical protein [Candidatus Omnitrophota bacterium]
MIDFFIQISSNPEKTFSRPSQWLNYYKKYVCIENETFLNQVYYYSNSFYDAEHIQSLYENEKHYFFIFGKVFYRNHLPEQTKKALLAYDVYQIVTRNHDHHKIIKGNYVFVLIDKNELSVTIVNSPFGVIPFNYATQDNVIYLSSNLTMILDKLSHKSINKSALVQISLFDTILGTNTLINEIKQLQYGQRVLISRDKTKEEYYYDHAGLISNKPLSRKDSIGQIIDTLQKNSALLPIHQPFLLGLTGGYDCRLNFALLPEASYNYLTAYTYGMSSSPEIRIAQEIAGRYNLHYEKVILEEDFEKNYVEDADEVLMISDGFAPFLRTNYLYAHRYLSKFAKECITGMYGSEFIRPAHVARGAITINTSTVQAFFSERILDSLVDYFYRIKKSPKAYFKEEIFNDEALDKTIELISENYIKGKESLTKEQRIFNFYLNEGVRKFFMELIRVDRMFVNHNMPYLDLDFLELLLNTEYAGVYNNAFNESLIKRRKGQLLYVDAINRLKPELNDIPVDRGYKPKYLRTGAGWVCIVTGYIFAKKINKALKGNTTFNTKKWQTMLLSVNSTLLARHDSLFNSNLFSRFQQGEYLESEHVFSRHYSLKRWFDINKLLY